MMHKKYGLLEDGTIEPLYYDLDGDLLDPDNERHIEYDVKKGAFVLYHDRWFDGNIAYCCHAIIRESDDKEELL